MTQTVAALYRFTPFEDPEALRGPLATLACGAGVRGTLLLAREGINGTVAGPAEGIQAVLAHIRGLPGCAGLEPKISHADTMPFRRLKVRVKAEIVTMGAPEADPTARVGTYVAPLDWNAVVDDPDVAVIDARNDYEVAIGRFGGAIDPMTPSFRDFPAWWEANREGLRGKRIAMYCTGGIRCEKASSWLLAQGVPEVLHLEGGILRYLEKVPAAESRWRGECFVFDGRVAVRHGVAPGSHSLCHACGRAVSPDDCSDAAYRPGVSCPACIGEYTDEDRARFAERQRQATLARARGVSHLAED